MVKKKIIRSFTIFEASSGAAAQIVTVKPTGCGFDPQSRRWNIYLNLYFHFFALVSRQSAALSSAIQHAMSPDSGRKCDCKTDWLWVRFPLEAMKYLLKSIFPFLHTGVEAKRGVEFCHSTRNASRIWQKVGNGVSKH